MKKFFLMLIGLLVVVGGCTPAKKMAMAELQNGGKMLIQVNDTRWNGEKVPAGEQGKTCGGNNPHFPSFTFDLNGLETHFKSRVVGISMYAYDIDWQGGHHGKWSYVFDSGKAEFLSPKVPSETNQMPDGVKGILSHSAQSCPAGYYLAPSSCRAGGGHRYFTDITLSLANGEKAVIKFNQGVF